MLMVHVVQNQRRVQRRRVRRRRMWVRPWLERRIELGQYTRLMEELRVEDVPAFKNFLRMGPDMFQELLQRLVPRLTKIDTFCRKALSPGLKLAFTLRYLASGDNYHSLMYSFRVPHNTISKVIPEVCEAIIAEFADEVIECPTTEQQWRGIADQFSNRWQFQHCLGALDGKHILGGIFYLLSSSIFCLLLSSDFFYLLISSIFCLLLSAQWLFVNELVGEIPAFYIHILLRVSSVAPPGLLRVSSGSCPGLIRGIPWLIRVFRGSSVAHPGSSVSRPGYSVPSPGVLRDSSG